MFPGVSRIWIGVGVEARMSVYGDSSTDTSKRSRRAKVGKMLQFTLGNQSIFYRRHSSVGTRSTITMHYKTYLVVVFIKLNRSFYPTALAIHPVCVLVHPRETRTNSVVTDCCCEM